MPDSWLISHGSPNFFPNFGCDADNTAIQDPAQNKSAREIRKGVSDSGEAANAPARSGQGNGNGEGSSAAPIGIMNLRSTGTLEHIPKCAGDEDRKRSLVSSRYFETVSFRTLIWESSEFTLRNKMKLTHPIPTFCSALKSWEQAKKGGEIQF